MEESRTYDNIDPRAFKEKKFLQGVKDNKVARMKKREDFRNAAKVAVFPANRPPQQKNPLTLSEVDKMRASSGDLNAIPKSMK